MKKKTKDATKILDELVGDDEEMRRKIAVARRESDIGNKLFQIWLRLKRNHQNKARKMLEDLMVECGIDWEG